MEGGQRTYGGEDGAGCRTQKTRNKHQNEVKAGKEELSSLSKPAKSKPSMPIERARPQNAAFLLTLEFSA